MPKPAIIRLDANAKMEQWPDFPESEVSSGDRSSHGHRWLEDKALGFSIGIWEADANLGRWMKWPVHEFMILLEGEVVMIEDDRETVIKAGESFFIPKGRRCIWNQAGYVKKFMVLFDDPAGSNISSQSSRSIRKVKAETLNAAFGEYLAFASSNPKHA